MCEEHDSAAADLRGQAGQTESKPESEPWKRPFMLQDIQYMYYSICMSDNNTVECVRG